MNRLELAQEISEKIKDITSKKEKLNLGDVGGFYVCAHDHYPDGLIFSVWASDVATNLAPTFDADLNLIKDNDYPESIDEAKSALKEFLEGEI